MTKMRVEAMPAGDLYVCGFPCQPFSKAGKNLGAQDARVLPIGTVMGYIEVKRPSIVVLENVAEFPTRHASCFKQLLHFLQGLGLYDVNHTILDTCNYGVPQSRKRLYIVMIKKRLLRLPFEWPTPLACPPLSKFWDRKDKTIIKSDRIEESLLRSKTSSANLINAYKDIKAQYGNPKRVEAVVDIGASPKFATWRMGTTPTLTSGRCGSRGYYSTTLQRRLSMTEMMRLQGCNPSDIDTRGTSQTALGKIVGNAMSVNVVTKVLEQALKAIAWGSPAASAGPP